MLAAGRHWICQQAERVVVLAACIAFRASVALVKLSVVSC
jgi:hypothetical protein